MEAEYRAKIVALEKTIHDMGLTITELTFKCTRQTMDGDHDTLSSEPYEMKGCPEQLDIANDEIKRLAAETDERYKMQMKIYGMLATLTAEIDSLKVELNMYYTEHSKDTDKLKKLRVGKSDLDSCNEELTRSLS